MARTPAACRAPARGAWWCAVLLPWSGWSPSSAQVIDLQLSAGAERISVGETITVDLTAQTASDTTQTFSVLDAVLEWDAQLLQLLSATRPCEAEPCPPGTYDWLDFGFPNPSPSGVNDTFDDGNALIWAVAQFAPKSPAEANAAGLWVARLSFEAVGRGTAEVALRSEIGLARTKIIHEPDIDVTGGLGEPAVLTVIRCPPPPSESVGSRYLSIRPAPQPESVGVRISGAAGAMEPVRCVQAYVQPGGMLSREPVTEPSEAWGTVLLSGAMIMPDTTYEVRADCSEAHGFYVLSAASTVSTARFGDLNHDGAVFIDDLLLVIDAAKGQLPPGMTLEHFDLAPCDPDGVVDDLDIAAVEATYSGEPYDCPVECDRLVGLQRHRELAVCLMGPGVMPDACAISDADADLDVDLADFAALQRQFDFVGE